MKTENKNIEKFNLILNESKEIILELIDNQINDYKLKHLTSWVQDHTIIDDESTQKVEELTKKKKELHSLFEKGDAKDLVVELNFSIDNKN